MKIESSYFDENSTKPLELPDKDRKKAYEPVEFDTDDNAQRPHSYRDAKPYRVIIRAVISHDTD